MNLKAGLILGLLAFAPISFADTPAGDVPSKDLFEQAQGKYAERQDLNNVAAAIDLLKQAATRNNDADLQFDILILWSRCVYFSGTKAEKNSEKLKIFEEAYKRAEEAKSINPDYADSYYYYGIALARWAEAKGVLESLFRKKELFDTMDATIERTTKAGEDGETIDGYGPDRVLGRVYFKLPGFAGGSRTKALKYANTSWENADWLLLNAQYLIEVLYDGDKDEKKQGCALADEVIARDPSTFPADRMPESMDELAEIKNIRSKMKCN